MSNSPARNILGGALVACCNDPPVGFYRDGSCNTGRGDAGLHTVCAIVTEEFLAFSRAQGNDLSTPRAEMGFPGLQPGDRWCLCAARWLEAYQQEMAPRVFLRRTHLKALDTIPLGVLKSFAVDLN